MFQLLKRFEKFVALVALASGLVNFTTPALALPQDECAIKLSSSDKTQRQSFNKHLVIGVVDPVSTGTLFVRSFQRVYNRFFSNPENQPRLIYIQSVDYSFAYSGTFHPEEFETGFRISVPPTPEDIQKLRDAGITHIVPGGDMAVVTAHDLSVALNLTQIDGGRADALKDKTQQQQILQRAGLPNIGSIYVQSADEAVNAWRIFGQQEVVIKPNEGAGTEGVSFERTEEGIRSAMNEIADHSNTLGFVNHGALVQERIKYPEYFFDTVTFFNPITKRIEHRVANAAKYRKVEFPGGKMPVYSNIRILRYNDPARAMMQDFVNQALDLYGVKSGATHTEIMMSSEGHIKPIEFNFRAAGVTLPEFLREYALRESDLNQVEMTALSILSPTLLAQAPEGWHLDNEFAISFLFAPRDGHFNRDAAMKLFEKYPGIVKEVHPNHQQGEEVKQTTDLFKVLGKVIIAHPDSAVVDQITEEIHQMNMSGAFLLP